MVPVSISDFDVPAHPNLKIKLELSHFRWESPKNGVHVECTSPMHPIFRIFPLELRKS